MAFNQLKDLIVNGNRLVVGYGFQKQELAKEIEAASNPSYQLDMLPEQELILCNPNLKLQNNAPVETVNVSTLQNNVDSPNLIPLISNSDLLVPKSSKSVTDDSNSSTLIISNSNLITSDNSLNYEKNKATILNITGQKLDTESSNSNIDKANVLFVSNLHPSATLDDLKGLSKRIQNAFFEENQGLR